MNLKSYVNKMEIKTTKSIIEDMSKLHMRNGYSIDYEPHYNKQWVSVDELIKQKNIDGFDLIKQLDELEEQLKGELNGNNP
jgi:hypothetical protein